MKSHGTVDRNRSLFREAARRGIDPRFWLYRFKWNCFPKLMAVSRAPAHIDIELTNSCNLRCVMCVHGRGGVKNQGLMDPGLARSIIDQAARIGVASMKFNWRGEATLHKSLPALIKHAKEKGILEVQLNTNGTLIDEKMIGSLIDSGLDRIIFSIDSATKEVYEKIRVGARYEDVVFAAERTFLVRQELGVVKPFIRVQMTMMKDNTSERKAYIYRWKDYADEVHISVATDRGQGSHMLMKGSRSCGRVRCTQPWQRLTISWEGIAFPCCADYFERWPVGDLRSSGLGEIWRGDGMNKMRSVQRKMLLDSVEPCKSCFCSDTFKWVRARD